MLLVDQIKAVQGALGLPQDGIAGPRTWASIYAALLQLPPVQVNELKEPPMITEGGRVDERSETAIATLHAQVQPYARALVNTCAQHGITIKVTSGTRTYAEQDAIFAQGRTKAGAIVTKARGGYSNHNFGIAFDVTMFDDGHPVYESPTYRAIGAFGKSLGLAWGGDWTSINDEPHFQLRPAWAKGISESELLAGLRERHDAGKDAFAA